MSQVRLRFDKLTTNGSRRMKTQSTTFDPSINSGQALRLVEGERILVLYCLIDLICGQDY